MGVLAVFNKKCPRIGGKRYADDPLRRGKCLVHRHKVKVLVENNPVMKETLKVLEKVSIDPVLLGAEEARRKALSDYNTNIEVAKNRGRV